MIVQPQPIIYDPVRCAWDLGYTVITDEHRRASMRRMAGIVIDAPEHLGDPITHDRYDPTAGAGSRSPRGAWHHTAVPPSSADLVVGADGNVYNRRTGERFGPANPYGRRKG